MSNPRQRGWDDQQHQIATLDKTQTELGWLFGQFLFCKYTSVSLSLGAENLKQFTESMLEVERSHLGRESHCGACGRRMFPCRSGPEASPSPAWWCHNPEPWWARAGFHWPLHPAPTHSASAEPMERGLIGKELWKCRIKPKELFYHQSSVLHIFSQQPVVIQGVLGLAGHSIHRAFIHLVLDGPEQHVERLTCRVLQKNPSVIARSVAKYRELRFRL